MWHVMVGLASLAAAYFVMQQNGAEPKRGKQQFIFGGCFTNSFLFVFAFALNFGMSMWITFVAGLVMYKNLPTQTFGYIQSKLFPYYFIIGAITGLTMLLIAIYSSRNNVELTKQQKSVLIAMSVTFLTNLCNGIFIGPRAYAIMFEKHRIEKETENKEELDNNPQYKAVKKSFGKIHGVSSLLNMFSVGAGCYMLYWISTLLHELS